MDGFSKRVTTLPFLGVGISTEYAASKAPGALDPLALAARAPHLASFLEVGIETAKGLDDTAWEWIHSGRRTTYHFLDVNLDEPEDFDDDWLRLMHAIASQVKPAWLCGDAGLWHFGPRERGHMLLLPPILCDDAAWEMAEGIVRLREALGYEVLPENPPGAVFVGDLHILDFFARVCERADTGMLLDCAHLAIYQRACGHSDPLTGLCDFPLERIVEAHVAGASHGEVDGYSFVEDDHTTAVLPDTWAIFDLVAHRARELRAVVYECERNPIEACLPGLMRIAEVLERGALHRQGTTEGDR